jgi:ubiquitin
LIMPKDTLHIRCILTDGRNEYQSQYTPLGQEIDINQGCLITAYPDMKFRLSLQARPDAYSKPKKQLTRLLSTAAKKPTNVVTNMINKDDGHFGQTRIQLRSVAHLCRNSLYTAAFDCYNNWSMVSKSSTKASAVRDNLVVVGNLVLQLYFIPHVEGTRVS